MTNEQWLPVRRYEGLYEVSDLGRVRSLDRTLHYERHGKPFAQRRRGGLKQPTVDKRGYPRVRLSKGGKAESLSAFVGPRPAGLMCCHADDVKTNNVLANLRWDTPRANLLDRFRNNPAKTHCKHGHEFTPENTYWQPKGRNCLACRRASKRKSYADRRAS